MVALPNVGVAGITKFSGSVYVPQDQLDSHIPSLYLRGKGDDKKLDITSSLKVEAELLSFSYSITTSFIEENNLAKNGYPINIEFIIGMKEKVTPFEEKFTYSSIQLNDAEDTESQNKAIVNTLIDNKIDVEKEEVSDEDIVDKASLLDNLVENDNFEFKIEKKDNENSEKVEIKANGTLSGKSLNCDREYCSNKGNCTHTDKFKIANLCVCEEGYSGQYCQMTEENKKIIKDYAKNAIKSVKKLLTTSETKVDSNTGAVTVVNKQKEVTPSLINAVSSYVSNGIDTIDNVEEAGEFGDVVKLIVTHDSPQSKENVVAHKEKIIDMIENMFDFSVNSIAKSKKQENVQTRLLSFIEKPLRILQDTTENLTPEQIYNNKVDLVIHHEDTRNLIVDVASSFCQHFNNKYGEELNKTNEDSLEYLKKQNITEFIIDKDNKHFTMMFTPIIDLNEFDFIKYFEKRVENNLSYIDPKKCLSTHANSYQFRSKKRTSDSVLNNLIFSLYVTYKNPMFTISDTLLTHAVTNTHSLILLDIKGNIIELDKCLDDILHFLPLSPRDQEFISRFNKNPKKYELFKTDNVTSINDINKESYMPIFIAEDGSIDKEMKIQDQIEKYYPTYKFYLSEYDVRNITHYNITINFDKIFSDFGDDSVKYIKNSQLVAASRKLGNMAVMSYYDPPTTPVDKYYFLKHDNIFKRSDNWSGNWCFITLAIIFAINIISIIIAIVIGCLSPKFVNKNSEVYKTEQIRYQAEYDTAKADDLIFDPSLNIYRNSIYGYLYLAEPSEKGKNSGSNDAAYDNKNPDQGIELQNVNIEMKDNQNVNSEAGLKSRSATKKLEPPKSNSFVHFAFKRNIYANIFTLTSPFNPTWKFLTKLFFLIYSLFFVTTCMFIYSGIDFNPNDNISYGPIAQSVFLSILISNFGFTLVNLLYSSMINSSRISNIIKTDFNGNSM